MNDIAEILRTEDEFLVVSHINPDGDAVGSLLGMYAALKEMGKSVSALAGAPIPDTYGFLPGFADVRTDPATITRLPRWIVAVDTAEENRIAGDLGPFREHAVIVNIDHHRTNPGFGRYNLVEPLASSTAEVIFRLLRYAGFKLSAEVGKCLYTGLITDTGAFRYSSVTGETLRLGADLLDLGFSSYDVTRHLYDEYPIGRLHMERLMLERMRVLLDGRLVVSVIYDEDFERVGAQRSDTENLVDFLRAVRGVEAAALITGVSENTRRVSLRSKSLVDVAQVAEIMGGGGHRRSSGARTSLSVEEIVKTIEDAVGSRFAGSS
ncbi:MAG: bifunctional oligoribonuclease/PAP phosphatase NrnA [Pseudomonadota bacterium]